MSNSIENIVYLNDINKLSKKDLQEICTEGNLDDKGTKEDLAYRIWDYIDKDSTNRDILNLSSNKLLAGRTSVIWYKVSEPNALSDFKQNLIRKCDPNPFETNTMPVETELTTQPKIISAIEKNQQEYYLRYVLKVGIDKSTYGNHVRSTPRHAIVNVYVDCEKGIIEIRNNDENTAEKIAEDIACMNNNLISLELVSAPFSKDIDEIANILDGTLMDTTAKVNIQSLDFDREQKIAILDVFNSIDDYFITDDLNVLESKLHDCKNKLANMVESTPLALLILCGLEKVGMAGLKESEVRDTTMHSTFLPYLEHQSAYIKFNYDQSGIVKDATIQVGLNKNSVHFRSSVSEEAIEFVRNKILS